MFEFLRRWFGGAAAPDVTAPQDRQAAADLAAAGLQVPPEPAGPRRSMASARGEYDRPIPQPPPIRPPPKA